jgi:sugar diacid utilization regulator
MTLGVCLVLSAVHAASDSSCRAISRSYVNAERKEQRRHEYEHVAVSVRLNELQHKWEGTQPGHDHLAGLYL